MKRCKARVADALKMQMPTVVHSERGATSAEYALILALVVVTLITTLSALGAALNEKLNSIIEEITNAG